jgi:hypothetical protein
MKKQILVFLAAWRSGLRRRDLLEMLGRFGYLEGSSLTREGNAFLKLIGRA